jgi:hypothetical protein
MLLVLTALLAYPPALPAPDSIRTVSGVSLPESIEVEGHTLVLNGMALRKKLVVSVYVAGLYLAEKSTSADAIVAADAPRRMVMHFKHDVDKKRLCEGWDDGLKNNTPDATAEVQAQFKELCGYMVDIKDGEAFTFTYLPGQGTQIDVKGEVVGTIPGKGFADALLRCWIGPKPGPGEGFKKKILGLER